MQPTDLDAIRDGVRAQLIESGAWQKLKANLRASVHSIVAGSGAAGEVNPVVVALRGNERAHLVLSLLADCLQSFGLTSTRSMLLTESGLEDLLAPAALPSLLGLPQPPPQEAPADSAAGASRHPSYAAIPTLLSGRTGAPFRTQPPPVPSHPSRGPHRASPPTCALIQALMALPTLPTNSPLQSSSSEAAAAASAAAASASASSASASLSAAPPASLRAEDSMESLSTSVGEGSLDVALPHLAASSSAAGSSSSSSSTPASLSLHSITRSLGLQGVELVGSLAQERSSAVVTPTNHQPNSSVSSLASGGTASPRGAAAGASASASAIAIASSSSSSSNSSTGSVSSSAASTPPQSPREMLGGAGAARLAAGLSVRAAPPPPVQASPVSPPPLRTGFVASAPVFASSSTPSPEARGQAGEAAAAEAAEAEAAEAEAEAEAAEAEVAEAEAAEAADALEDGNGMPLASPASAEGTAAAATAAAATALASPSSEGGYSDGFEDTAAPSPALSELSPLGPGAAPTRAAAAAAAAQAASAEAGASAAAGSGLPTFPQFEIAEGDIDEEIGGSGDSDGLGAF